MGFKKLALLVGATAICTSAYAMQNVTQGIAFSYGSHLITQSQPTNISGYKIDYNIMPSNWNGYNNSLVAYIQANYAHWHTNSNIPSNSYSTIGVFGIAPVARWYFMDASANLAPYAEASIGAATLTHNVIGDRLLGSRLLFQDMLGIGATFGQSKQAFASVNLIHYSNASTHRNNAGITIPVMLTVGYNFS